MEEESTSQGITTPEAGEGKETNSSLLAPECDQMDILVSVQ